MYRWGTTVVFALLFVAAIPGYGLDGRPAADARAAAAGEPAIDVASAAAFVANRGQLGNDDVLFSFDGGGLRVGFAERAVLYDLRGDRGGVLVRAEFEGARPVRPEGHGELGHRTHYLLGRDPAGWRTDVPSFREVAYEGLYDGVDLRYRIAGGAAKYELILAAGVDPGRIRIAYAGAESLSVDPSGDLVVRTALGEIRDTSPVADQEGVPVPCRFALRADAVTFDCPGRDPARPLVIDPLVYASYLGGENYDDAHSIAVDGAGNAYVAGATRSLTFPTTPGAYDPSYNLGQFDAFVAKFDADAAVLVYSTYLGGNGDDEAMAIAVDAFGNATVTGWTTSVDFPATPGAFDGVLNGTSDAFVARLDPTGGSLVFATLLGGDGQDQASALTVDASGNPYLGGVTGSADFPATPGALQGSLRGFTDGFVAGFDATGTALAFATFLGGNGFVDIVTSVARDGSGNLYVTGGTDAADFPTSPGAYDRVLNGTGDAFVAKLDPAGSALLYGTYVGGAGGPFEGEIGFGIAVDVSGNAFVAGETNTADFPTTPGAFNETYGGLTDGFVLKLNASGDALLYSTFLGGSSEDQVQGLRVDGLGRAHVAGFTASADFPTTVGALDTTLGGTYDAFAVNLNATGGEAVYSTLLGGSQDDQAFALALDAAGAVYLSGVTNAADFPATAGAYNRTLSGDYDGFVAKLTLAFPVTVDAIPSGLQLVVDGTPRATPYTFDCDPGSNHTLDAPTPQTYLQARWAFDSWSDAGARTHGITCIAPETYVARYLATDYEVTVTTSPPGLQTSVDGAPGSGPRTFWWGVGSGHAVAAPSPQVAGSTRYLYQSWSDAGAQTHVVTVLAPTTYVAYFSAEYEIVVDTSPPNLDVRVDGSTFGAPYAFWCGAGTTRTIEATNPVPPPGVQLTFLSWSDGGAQSHDIACTVPGTFTATYLVEFRITVGSAPTGLNVTVDAVPFPAPYAFWCANATARTVGAPSPQAFGPIRHVFLSWSDGGAQSHDVTCAAPATFTATFAREYEVSVDTIPARLLIEVNGTPQSAPYSFWCREGTNRTLGAPSPQGTGGTRYPFVAWTDGLPRTHAITCDQPRSFTALFDTQYAITIATNPPGLEVVVNGTPTTTPQTYWWGAGTVHSLNATTPQGTGRSRWAFASWSDSGAANHSVIPASPQTFTASFVAEHEVVFDSAPAGLVVSVDGTPYTLPHAFWWREGSSHAVAVGSPQAGTTGTRYAFASWSDGGVRNRTVSAAAPTDLVASFATQYHLTATSPHGTPMCGDSSDCWYDAGRTATLQVELTVTDPIGTRYVFLRWTGDATGLSPVIPVLMDGPKSAAAEWTTEHFLRVVSPFGNATGEGWYPEGGTASFAVVATESAFGGKRYRFLRWEGDANTTARAGTVVMDGPRSVTAIWEELTSPDVGTWIWIVPAIVAVLLALWFLWFRRRRKEEDAKPEAEAEEEAGGPDGEASPDLEEELDLDARPER